MNAVRSVAEIRHALLESLIPELDSGSNEQIARALAGLAETIGMVCVASSNGTPADITAMLELSGSIAAKHATAFLQLWGTDRPKLFQN